MTARNVLYVQSGGVTAVINASAAGVIETARRHRGRIGKVFAAHGGLLGALSEELIDTSRESAAAIAALKHTPGGAFGSSRYTPGPVDTDPAPYARLIEVFRAHDIGAFLYNGGNGSMDTAWRIAALARKTGYPIVSIGIPKTVDNDIVGTDCSPGFGSAAKYVASSIREAALDLASMAHDSNKSSTKLFVLEVMGRNTGWLAAAAGLAAERAGDAPQVLLLPEIPFEADRFVRKVASVIDRDGWCAVVVSEGIRGASGQAFASIEGPPSVFGPLGGVAPGIARLAGERLGVKYHWAVASYLQRAARHLASQTDVDQAYAVGRAAIELVLAGANGVMPSIRRISDRPYRWKIAAVPLGSVANKEREVPRRYISADGFHITASTRRYLAPLIEGEAAIPFERGLPRFGRLKLVPIAKRLPRFPAA